MWIVFFNTVLNHRLEKLVQEPKEGNAWHADHIIPVYRGGGTVHAHFCVFLAHHCMSQFIWFLAGECTLENVRTLCVACHADVTKAQQKELKELRKKAKELLRNAINQQKNDVSSSSGFQVIFHLGFL